jgi:hypothetical protein
MACQELALHLSHDDNALQLLLKRRAEMAERLAVEIDDRTFLEPDIEGFDSTLDALPVSGYLSVSEALLLDLALSSREDGEPWLTFGEAEAHFGQKAADAATELSDTRARLLGWNALLTAAVGVLAGVTLWLAAEALDVDRATAVSGSIAVSAFALAFAFAVLAGAHPDSRFPESLGAFSALVAVCMALEVINLQPKKPYVSDATGIIIGAVIVGLGLILFLAISWAVRDRKGTSKT